MKIKNCAAQGDLYISRIDGLPDGLTAATPDNGVHIVAHSETSHHHVVAAEGCEYFRTDDPMTAYLRVIDAAEVTLKHLRAFDTHEPLTIGPGIYRIRRQREYTPKGWRRVAD